MKFNQVMCNQIFWVLSVMLCVDSKHKHPLRESYGEDPLDVNFCNYMIEQELKIRHKKHAIMGCMM